MMDEEVKILRQSACADKIRLWEGVTNRWFLRVPLQGPVPHICNLKLRVGTDSESDDDLPTSPSS